MKKHRITLLLLLAMSILGGQSASLWGRGVIAQTKPPVLAFYYAWYDENTWTSGRTADTPSTTYRSADPAAIERHVAQAKGAGIDAFVQSWYGPQVENNQTETNFRVLLETAARYQFQAAVDVEVTGPFFPDRNAVQAALATLLATHVHHPAYFRFQGKPVIFFWRQHRFSPAEWAQIREAVDPNRTTYWIAEGVDLSFQEVFDGHHLYSIAWANNPQAELNKWPPRLKQVEARLGVDKLWVATAMPGYNDLKLPRSNAFARDRQDGAYYRESWAAAQATNPDMIIITSFNEWLEGTYLEPSVTYGDFYLNLTRELINGLGAAPPPPPSEAPAVVEAPAPAEPALADPPPKAESPAVPIPAEEGPVYVVQSGDTLYAIAGRLGVAAQAIIEANGLSDPDQLAVGQALVIPGLDISGPNQLPEGRDSRGEAISYTVQAGDTLYDIALKFGSTVAAIVAVNQIADPDSLAVGQVLKIPGEAPPETEQPQEEGPAISLPPFPQTSPDLETTQSGIF